MTTKSTDPSDLWNPEARYDSPKSLADDDSLTIAERVSALERWRFTVSRRIESSGEGMAVADDSDKDAELAREIELAIERIKG